MTPEGGDRNVGMPCATWRRDPLMSSLTMDNETQIKSCAQTYGHMIMYFYMIKKMIYYGFMCVNVFFYANVTFLPPPSRKQRLAAELATNCAHSSSC